VLFSPDRHEPLAAAWDEAAARAAIERIVERAWAELDREDGRWPLHPSDAEGEDDAPASGLYCGGAGIAWALGELGAPPERAFVEALEAKLVAEPDDPGLGVGGVWSGVAGVLAVAEHLWPDEARRDRLSELAWESLDSPALEIMYGHPGHMTLAGQLGDWEFWNVGAERLLAAWEHDQELGAWLWTQRLGERDQRMLGAAHGVAANVQVLLQGPERDEVERRAVETMTTLAAVGDGHANWPAVAGEPLTRNDRVRVQWCHGAPGVLTTLWSVAPDDEEWSELLLAAGRLVWDAGPIKDAAGLCHGTAGNAYALLALWRRTGDEEWLERARAFAAHASAQTQGGHHSLFTGDEGVAMCLASCLEGDARLPVADRLL
jgi:hypothetical protein